MRRYSDFTVRNGAGAFLLCLLTSPALAVDCAKAAEAVDRQICANPSLVNADAAMSRAYFALVRTSPNPEIHKMLVHSQRRWIGARNAWLKKEKVSEEALRAAMLERAHALEDRSDTGFVARARSQQQLLSRYTGGALAGFRTRCEFIPDDQTSKHRSYVCMGVAQSQNGSRICSIESDWATWRIFTSVGVGEIRQGKVVPLASCDLGGGCDLSTNTGWKTGADMDTRQMFPSATGLPKLDAEADFFADFDSGSLGECLTALRYPSRS